METYQSLSTLNEHVLTEHAQIFSTLVRTSRLVDSLLPSDPDPAVVNGALEQLAALDNAIRRHFQTEEASDMTGRLVTVLPEAAGEISRLAADHDEVRALLARMRSAERQRSSPIAVQELADDLELLLDLLYSHEATEDRLLAEAVRSEADHTGGRL